MTLHKYTNSRAGWNSRSVNPAASRTFCRGQQMYTWRAHTHTFWQWQGCLSSGEKESVMCCGLPSRRGDPDAKRRVLLLWHTRRGVKSSMASAGAVETVEFVFSCTSWAVKWVSKHMAKKPLSHCCCWTALTTSADVLGAVWAIWLQKSTSWWRNIHSWAYARPPQMSNKHKHSTSTHRQDSDTFPTHKAEVNMTAHPNTPCQIQ